MDTSRIHSKPIDEFVVKIASRCNLDCDYCYEYNLGDSSWKQAPRFLSTSLARALYLRIRDYVAAHRIPRVTISFHGGEPLLAGARRLDEYATIFSQIRETGCEIDITTQTNCTLVSREICEVLGRHRIAVGVSLDGPRGTNDKHRVDHHGRSTFERVISGIDLLKRLVPGQPSGLLAVIDVHSDPLATFDFLADLGIPYLDLLLPHHHWSRPPPRPGGDRIAYGRWYYAIWKEWIAGRNREVSIRFFENLIRHMCGAASIFESNSLDPVSLITISTGGAAEAVDTLKSTSSGAHRLGLHVLEHGLDEVARHEQVRVRQLGTLGLCGICQKCELLSICGGGYLPHRYSHSGGFDNPSVYCEDLIWLIKNMLGDIRRPITRNPHPSSS